MKNEIKEKKKILIITGHYLPGVKGGGPIQSIKNIVDNLKNKFEFYIITLDRDLGDNQAYDNININSWQQVGNANVYYISQDDFTMFNIITLINKINYDYLYLNTFFGIKTGLVPILAKRLNKIKIKNIIVAPRGQFSDGALQIKSFKKQIYIYLFKFLNLHANIIWQATTEIEKKEIINIFGKEINIKLANNLTANYDELVYKKDIDKDIGVLKLVFISRITSKKNLHKAIQLLYNIKGKVIFDIYGPIEDKEYWKKCKEEILNLNNNIIVNYNGIIEHDNLREMFSKYHMMLFPTLGENFGHVISESLIGGCPVIISDQTPWRNLKEIKVGWDIPLSNEKEFIKVIQECVDMDKEKYDELSISAFSFAKMKANSSDDLDNTENLFK